MGTLYLVATPIGNLEDITLRALQLLRSAILIAAEDTRHTQKLLNRYEISTPTMSYHEHNKLSRVGEVLSALAQGDVALVSDAGTPGLNDPGYELVRAALQAGFPVSAAPGPSAPMMALVISGLPTDSFLYMGYLPRRTSERRQRITGVGGQEHTLIFLETPHRLVEALEDLYAILGDRPVAVGRELTKLHEEMYRGRLADALAFFQANAPRGEFTLVVGGKTPGDAGPWEEERLMEAARIGLAEGTPISQLAAELEARSGWQRREVYRKILDWKNTGDGE